MPARFRTLGEKRNACVALASPDAEGLLIADDDDVYLTHWFRTQAEALKRADWSRPSLVLLAQGDGLKEHDTGGLYHGGWGLRREAFDRVRGYAAQNNGRHKLQPGWPKDFTRLPVVKRFTTAPHVSHRDGRMPVELIGPVTAPGRDGPTNGTTLVPANRYPTSTSCSSTRSHEPPDWRPGLDNNSRITFVRSLEGLPVVGVRTGAPFIQDAITGVFVDRLPPGAKCVQNDSDEAALAAFMEVIRCIQQTDRHSVCVPKRSMPSPAMGLSIV